MDLNLQWAVQYEQCSVSIAVRVSWAAAADAQQASWQLQRRRQVWRQLWQQRRRQVWRQLWQQWRRPEACGQASVQGPVTSIVYLQQGRQKKRQQGGQE
jgi:hypothetical protein